MAQGLRVLFQLPDRLHGKGNVVFSWNSDGTLLCTAGSNGLVHIFNRHGQQVCDVLLESRAQCVAIEWDKDGESVAIVQSGVDRVAVWEVASRNVYYIDSGLGNPTWAKWSKTGPQLAVGSARGALLMFRKDTRKKALIPGKHGDAILCGDWSTGNKLALGGRDVVLTISNEAGETEERVELKHEPAAVQFAAEKGDAAFRAGGAAGGAGSGSGSGSAASGGSSSDTTVSVNMGGKTVLLYNLLRPSHPAELLFQAKYGRIVSYRWFGDGYVLLGFEEGFLVVISTHKDEIKEEVFSGRFHKERLTDIACSAAAQRAASAGGNLIKLLDMSTWRELRSEFAATDAAHGSITRLEWTPDGQILTAATANGTVYAFLGRLPAMVDACAGRVASMSSLREASVVELGPGGDAESSAPAAVPVAVEPSLLALGPTALAVSMNNRAWYYRLPGAAIGGGMGVGGAAGGGAGSLVGLSGPGGSAAAAALASGPVLLASRDYVSTVDEIKLADKHAIVRCGGRLYVHELVPPTAAGGATGGGAAAGGAGSAAAAAMTVTVLPQREDGSLVTCAAVAGSFLVYGTSGGRVELFSLADGKTLAGHECVLPALGAGEGSGGSSSGSGAVPSVRAVFPNALGTRVVVLDAAGRGFLLNPIDGARLPVPGLPRGASRVLWDAADRTVFAAFGERAAATYLYCGVSMTGPTVTQLGALEIQPNGDMVVDPLATALPAGAIPLALAGGTVTLHSGSGGGAISTLVLATHVALAPAAAVMAVPGAGGPAAAAAGASAPFAGGGADADAAGRLRAAFGQCVALLRLREAWELAVRLDDRSVWMALSGKAMEVLELELAQRAYRLVGDAAMVASLDRIMALDDRQAVAANVALLFGDLPLAQELFLASSTPLAALDMRKDLRQWDVALRLAETLAPEQVPAISLELARSLEVRGEYAQALATFTAAAARLPPAPREGASAEPAAVASLRAAVTGGLARMTLRQGDLRRGMALALESGDKVLCRDCAAILEGLKQHGDAAALYKAAELWDKAAGLFMQSKNFAAAGALMDKVTAPRLHATYAKAREASKDYAEAARGYERARDTDALVRLLLTHLDAPERAAAIVRATRSAEGAAQLARYCVEAGDVRGAIEFLLLARRRDDAFQLALKHAEMPLYVQALRVALAAAAAGTDVVTMMAAAAASSAGSAGGAASATDAALAAVRLPADECARIAAYYEGAGDAGAAGAIHLEAGAYPRALQLFLSLGDAGIDRAIECVGRARSEAVTHALIDYLMGESDGIPKDPRHIFRLYVALGNYGQAAKTALVIARQEQEAGNYKAAHGTLAETFRDLSARGVRAPHDLLRALTLVHSYLLVKRLVRLENHEAAAAMMTRVAASVSLFPQHVVPILTSTVIECQRAGLKRSAHEYALMLMRPEHREAVEPKFAKKIEALVRRPSSEEADLGSAPCPFCDRAVPAFQLSCDSCRATIPFCIVSGKHMTLEDCSSCPHCRFPALHSALAAYLTVEPTCPMCSTAIAPASISLVPEPLPFLRKAAAVTGDGGDESPPAAAAAGAGAGRA